MTDTPTNLPAARPAVAAGGQVGALVPQTIDEAWRLSEAFAKSKILPRGITEPAQVMLVICGGAEVGFGPFQSLQSFALINNRLTIWGDAIPALLWSKGFKIKEWFENVGADYPNDMVAKCVITRPDGLEVEGEFSVADAKEAKLWSKDGPWQTARKRMLKMRARAFAARDGASDVLRGMPVQEEIQDVPPEVTAASAAPQALHAGFSDVRDGEVIEGPKPTRGKRGKAAQQVEELQRTQSGGAGDVLDGDNIPVEGGARPTETAGAPNAEAEQASSGSATAASTASAEESSSPTGSSEPTDDGPGESEIDRINREAREQQSAYVSQDVIEMGDPAPDEIYHLDGDTWDEKGRRASYKNGEPFSTAGRAAGLKVYADHAPAPGASDEPEDEEQSDDGMGDLPAEFRTYIEAIENAPTFADVKRAMQTFYTSDLFNGFTEEQRNKVRADTWATCLDRKLPLPDHASDISAFRLWIEHEEDADAIMGTMRVWEQDETFSAEPPKGKPPSFKQSIRQAVANRVSILQQQD